MSVSKLESLANETLIELFEKYMDCVDIVVGFGYLNNNRFNALISQCQRFNFDFRNCQKGHFRKCLKFLSTDFIGKIEELILSDKNTPGQIGEFFSFFPQSFNAFKRLRKLHFHINNYGHWLEFSAKIDSLSNTVIDTVLIEIMDTDRGSLLYDDINKIMDIKTMKRFSFTNKAEPQESLVLHNFSSKIEYLKYSDMSYGFKDLSYIVQCASDLKYLNIQLNSNFYFHHFYQHQIRWNEIISIPTLRTLILSFKSDDMTTLDELAQCLKMMPALRRLKIRAHAALLVANTWQDLLETSLPLLKHFTLKSTISRIGRNQLDDILASFETPFWIEKENFYLIITEHKKHLYDEFFFKRSQIINQDEFSHPVIQWWIVPTRARIDDLPTKDIVNVGITIGLKYLSDYYYFKNVKHLVVYELDQTLLECFVRSMNYLGIEHLDVSEFKHNSSTFTFLPQYLRNITSLRIQHEHLFHNQIFYLEQYTGVKHLDISITNHSFLEQDIITISKLFPKLEHLVINTSDLSNVPLMNTYLPHLCSLTLPIINRGFRPFHDRDDQKFWEDQFRRKVKFSFHLNDKGMTVWIDEDTLKSPYWEGKETK